MVGSECGEEREMVVVHVGDSCVCGRQSQEGGRSVVVSIIWRCVDMQLCDYRETIVSVSISCDSGIAIKIFTHESPTTAENLHFILILHVFLCGVWSECERIQLCVMCWEAVVIVGVI